MFTIKQSPNGKAVMEGGHVDFDYYRKKPLIVCAVQVNQPFVVETLEGFMYGEAGDYLIRGIKGEYYPCKPDIFEATYESITKMDPS